MSVPQLPFPEWTLPELEIEVPRISREAVGYLEEARKHLARGLWSRCNCEWRAGRELAEWGTAVQFERDLQSVLATGREDRPDLFADAEFARRVERFGRRFMVYWYLDGKPNPRWGREDPIKIRERMGARRLTRRSDGTFVGLVLPWVPYGDVMPRPVPNKKLAAGVLIKPRPPQRSRPA